MTVSVTYGTLDEIKRICIVYEKSVQVVSVLIADLTGGRQVIDFWQFPAADVANRTVVRIDICDKKPYTLLYR